MLQGGIAVFVIANIVDSNVFLLTLCLGVVYVSGNDVGTIIFFELAVTLASVADFAIIVFIDVRRWIGEILILGYVMFLVAEFTVFRRYAEFIIIKAVFVHIWPTSTCSSCLCYIIRDYSSAILQSCLTKGIWGSLSLLQTLNVDNHKGWVWDNVVIEPFCNWWSATVSEKPQR